VIVDAYAELVCPFTYVGLRRMMAERVRRGIDVRFRVRAWPLEWVNGEPLAPDHVGAEVEALRAQVAPDWLVGFDPRVFPTTSIPGLALTSVAYERDLPTGEAVAFTLREEVFEHGHDVSDPEVLARVAARFDVAVPSAEAGERLVRSEYEEGRQRGVVGSPHVFLASGDRFCPTLRIEPTGDTWVIEWDDEGLETALAG